MNIILASSSPRRKELLTMAGMAFETVSPDVDETLDGSFSPEDAVLYLSRLKGENVYKRMKDSRSDPLVLSSDTVVSIDGVILGKPSGDDDSKRMLRLLSGRTHQVYTGVYLRHGGNVLNYFEKTDVTFLGLSDEEIDDYIKTGEGADKAGSYAVQGKGSLFVKRIEGDYYTVVGLPIARVARDIKRALDGSF